MLISFLEPKVKSSVYLFCLANSHKCNNIQLQCYKREKQQISRFSTFLLDN